MLRPDRVERHWSTEPRRLGIWLSLIAVAGFAIAQADPALRSMAVFLIAFPILWSLISTVLSWTVAASLAIEMPDPGDEVRSMAILPLLFKVRNLSRWLPAINVRLDYELRGGDFKLDYVGAGYASFLLPGTVIEMRWHVAVRTRGDLIIGPVRADVEFPGSLLRGAAWFTESPGIRILPASYDLDPSVVQLLAGKRLAAGRISPVPAAIEQYIGSRHFRPGDNPKLIHRVLSLKAQEYPFELFVREFEDPTEDDVSIVLDTAPDPERADLCSYRLEKAVAFAASFCRELSARKFKIRFVCHNTPKDIFDRRLRPLDQDINGLERFLSGVRLTGDRATIQGLLQRECRRRGPAVVFISMREVAEERQGMRLPVVTVTPDVVPVFTREVHWT